MIILKVKGPWLKSPFEGGRSASRRRRSQPAVWICGWGHGDLDFRLRLLPVKIENFLMNYCNFFNISPGEKRENISK
jgi:hypothetical protein